MTGLIIVLLTVVLVLDCTALVFLVLIQLPKKEAGLGLAFGGGAADALFGAGSGTILTKATKYAAGIFFALAIVLSVMEDNRAKGGKSGTLQLIEKGAATGGSAVPQQPLPAEAGQPQGAILPPATLPGSNVTAPSTSAPISFTPIPAAPVSTNPTPPK